MKMQKLLITFATVIVTLTGCESDKNNPIQEPQQEKPLSFTEMKTKYVDKLLTYEYSKQETAEIQKIARSNKNSTLDLKSMSLDEKCDIINELNELKNAPKPSLVAGEQESTQEDEAFYIAQYNALLAEINEHPLVVAELAKNDVKLDPSSMTYSIGEQVYSKFDILQQAEHITTTDGPQRLARYTLLSKWPKAPKTIDYRFGKSVSDATKNGVRSAMTEWEAATNNRIKYREISNSGWNQFVWGLGVYWHIWIHEEDIDAGGYSSLGYVPWSAITIKANKGNDRTYRHELGHSLGLIHEHQRPDRDDYVIVIKDNIKPEFKYAFDKYLKTSCQTYGEFDFKSIMLYPSDAFSKNGQSTITKKDGTTWGVNYYLSAMDKEKIKEIYN